MEKRIRVLPVRARDQNFLNWSPQTALSFVLEQVRSKSSKVVLDVDLLNSDRSAFSVTWQSSIRSDDTYLIQVPTKNGNVVVRVTTTYVGQNLAGDYKLKAIDFL